MEYERLRLTKEEVLVSRVGESDVCLYVPIHPKLILPETKIDPEIPNQAFERAAVEWYDDLEALAQSGNYSPKQVQWWKEVFLADKRPRVEMYHGRQVMRYGNSSSWENNHDLQDNGFMNNLSISRNGGGSLGFDLEQNNCQYYIFTRRGRSPLQIFDVEKAKEFSFGSCKDGETFRVYVYAPHNVDCIPGAVMLRNWALAYMDEALRTVAT